MIAQRFFSRHALFLYFLIAYAITWLSLLGLFGSTIAAGQALTMANIGIMFLAMLAGPSTSGLVMTSVVDGRAGLRELWARFLRWRLPVRWYAVAVLTLPTLALLALGTAAVLFSPQYTPNFVPVLFVFGLVAGLIEEIGWTGFALPRLLNRYHPLTAALLLGVLWACWHAMADYLGNAPTMGSLWPLNFVVYWLLPLTAYRVLMVWVYNHTHSLWLMQVMHAFYTGTLLVLSPAVAFPQALTWEALFTALLCATTIGVVVATRLRLGCPTPATGHAQNGAAPAEQSSVAI